MADALTLPPRTSGIRPDPCAEPPSPEHPIDPCAFVLFGATGDLTRRKIVPALFSLWFQGALPERFVIVAFARRSHTDESFRAELLAAVREFAPKLKSDGPEWADFAANVTYLRSTLDDDDGYKRLGERLAELDRERSLNGNRLYYLATPPDNFAEIVEHLGKAGLTSTPDGGGWSRVIIEKPFGHDVDSARALNRQLRAVLSEDQIYRIDHYLGKETVQNILVLRFANQIFEPLWNCRFIDHVQITVAETLGMEGRGAYFDHAGITRDMVQNHALQVLTLIAMEAPVALSADAIRDEKVKVLRSMRPFDAERAARYTVRGQYGPGVIRENGKEEHVPGYREEDGIAPDSTTETFAAFRFDIDDWRWAGVPFYVMAGKRLPVRATEVQITFKAVPDVLFARLQCAEVRPNRLTIRIQPNEGASLEIGSKAPGSQMRVQPVNMDFRYGTSFDQAIHDAYERLIVDAIRGDASLFARDDEVEAAWTLITPILDAWRAQSGTDFPNYAAGSWGPEDAASLMPEDQAWSHPHPARQDKP